MYHCCDLNRGLISLPTNLPKAIKGPMRVVTPHPATKLPPCKGCSAGCPKLALCQCILHLTVLDVMDALEKAKGRLK